MPNNARCMHLCKQHVSADAANQVHHFIALCTDRQLCNGQPAHWLELKPIQGTFSGKRQCTLSSLSQGPSNTIVAVSFAVLLAKSVLKVGTLVASMM